MTLRLRNGTRGRKGGVNQFDSVAQFVAFLKKIQGAMLKDGRLTREEAKVVEQPGGGGGGVSEVQDADGVGVVLPWEGVKPRVDRVDFDGGTWLVDEEEIRVVSCCARAGSCCL
jgi:hypothetical protein